MALDVFFREDVARILAAVVVARGELTTDERTILGAVAAGFGVPPVEVLRLADAARVEERRPPLALAQRR